MLMDTGMDSGPVLAQRKVGISSMDTTGTLTSKLAGVGAQVLLDILPRWLAGKLKPQPQDESQATYSELISKEDGEMDWCSPAVELWRRVRAFNPWPSCYTWWEGKRLKIHEATPLGDMAKGKIGEVLALTEPVFGVGIVTGSGILGLSQVQLEGKRKMKVGDFVRGQRDFIGSILG
jgi:methionyl-tRNA formyltransferase